MTQRPTNFHRPFGTLALALIFAFSLFQLSCATPAQTDADSFSSTSDSATQPAQTHQILQGKVVAILDGDTIIVLNAKKESFKIRFKGIDAPEKSQTFGQQAKENLSSLIFNRNVSVQWQERDRYQRILGKVEIAGQDIGLKMIENGYAWHYKRFQESQQPSDRISYAEAENRSRQQKIGLWQDPNPMPPWEYRTTN
jgi:endonuclease YncB( thermonuclease family)